MNILVYGKDTPVAVLELVNGQGYLDDGGKNMEHLYVIDLSSTWKIDPTKIIIYVVMFYGDLNVQLGGEPLKIHYPKLTTMYGFEHTVYLFLNDVYKMPIVNQIIKYCMEVYKLFGSGIYHNLYYIFK